MLRIVPLAHRGRVNWWLIVDRGAELSYILIVDLFHPLIEFGQHVSQRSGLADGIERHVPSAPQAPIGPEAAEPARTHEVQQLDSPSARSRGRRLRLLLTFA